MKKEIVLSLGLASVSLTAAALCHGFLPGYGALLKPLLWPLFALPFVARLRVAAPVAFLVPVVSAAVSGMPSWPVAASLALGCAAAVAALCAARLFACRLVGKI